MSIFIVDVESDGPIPPKFSMVSFGAVRLDRELKTTFKGMVRPISDQWNPEALAISNISRETHLTYDDPAVVMSRFSDWIRESSKGQPIFMADNNGYDFAWINYYFHTYLGRNPFGWSSRRIGDLYCGMMKDGFARWKHLRTTKHTHDPVDDAMGNAEAVLKMVDMGLKLPTK